MVTQSPALPLHRAGVVVRLNGELRFLSAQSVRRFVPLPVLSDVAGTGLTMALVDGQVLPIIAVGPRGSALTVCEVGAELVGLIGADPEAVGFFEADGSGAMFHGQRAAALDVAELVRASVRRGGFEHEGEA
ncbi:MAG: hypothetical protein EOO73_28465 [Myxococcales bacterium]|nr:MAG: hypothetical protein EOO73_28465 [Myxococcales bacterium]